MENSWEIKLKREENGEELLAWWLGHGSTKEEDEISLIKFVSSYVFIFLKLNWSFNYVITSSCLVMLKSSCGNAYVIIQFYFFFLIFSTHFSLYKFMIFVTLLTRLQCSRVKYVTQSVKVPYLVLFHIPNQFIIS